MTDFNHSKHPPPRPGHPRHPSHVSNVVVVFIEGCPSAGKSTFIQQTAAEIRNGTGAHVIVPPQPESMLGFDLRDLHFRDSKRWTFADLIAVATLRKNALARTISTARQISGTVVILSEGSLYTDFNVIAQLHLPAMSEVERAAFSYCSRIVLQSDYPDANVIVRRVYVYVPAAICFDRGLKRLAQSYTCSAIARLHQLHMKSSASDLVIDTSAPRSPAVARLTAINLISSGLEAGWTPVMRRRGKK
ncbi:MAG: hypothetical protein CMA10_04480 [Euryarchaeota archaeon]|nr:hypothetical protein [Euryarchaeota archaeon]|tara:strand:- start:577 stop:1317 length:741 start_codon:yes stop_codon:yes gene_type:complete